MKKIFLALLAFLGIFTLASCGEDENPEAKNKTIVTYMGWDAGSKKNPKFTRLLIDKFNAEHDSIYIQVKDYQDPYNSALKALAAGKKLPDVFMVESVPNAIVDDYALDITKYATADSEWKDVETSLKKSITYFDRVYALPSAQHYAGYFVNNELLEDIGYDSDTFEVGKFTSEKFIEVIKAAKYTNTTDGDGTIGINNTGDMINWLPASLDETGTLGHYLWDGENLDFKNKAVIDAFTLMQSISSSENKYTFASLEEKKKVGEEEIDVRKEIFGSTSDLEVFENGNMVFYQGNSYSDFTKAKFDYEFIGYPDGKVISIADYMCISKSCKNPEAAYEVAKYLSYGAAGIEGKISVAKEQAKDPKSKIKLVGLPANTNTEVTKEWFDYVTLPGFKEVYKEVASGNVDVLVESNKSVPGFLNARFEYLTSLQFPNVAGGTPLKIGEFMWQVASGNILVSQYETSMDKNLIDTLNKIIDDAEVDIKKITDATKAQEASQSPAA